MSDAYLVQEDCYFLGIRAKNSLIIVYSTHEKAHDFLENVCLYMAQNKRKLSGIHSTGQETTYTYSRLFSLFKYQVTLRKIVIQ